MWKTCFCTILDGTKDNGLPLSKHLQIVIALRIAHSIIACCRFASINRFFGALDELDMFFCVSVCFLGEQIAKAHLV